MRKKSELYPEEQKMLLDRLLEISQIETRNLNELDQDTDMQNDILEMIPEIRKYYSFDLIEGLRNPNACLRPWLCIIRGICKANNVKLESKGKQTKSVRTRIFNLRL